MAASVNPTLLVWTHELYSLWDRMHQIHVIDKRDHQHQAAQKVETPVTKSNKAEDSSAFLELSHLQQGSNLVSQKIRTYDKSVSCTRSAPRTTSSLGTIITRTVWYRGVLGHMYFVTKSKHSRGLQGTRSIDKKPICSEKVIRILPSFWKHRFEMQYMSSLSRLPRSLNVWPVMDFSTTVFGRNLLYMCVHGDKIGFGRLFDSGKVSPFVLSQNGSSLLHVGDWQQFLQDHR